MVGLLAPPLVHRDGHLRSELNEDAGFRATLTRAQGGDRPAAALWKERAEQLLRVEPRYFYDESFQEADAGERAERSLDLQGGVGTLPTNRSTDFYVAFLYESRLLTPEEERLLFWQMHYALYRAHRVRQQLRPQTATRAEVEAVECWEARAERLRNRLVECNLRLVTSRAKQFAKSTGLPLDDVISEGHLGLLRAAEMFDYRRGLRFSTYATRVISNRMLAFYRKSSRYTQRCGGTQDLLRDQQDRRPEVPIEVSDREWLARFRPLVDRLNPREQMIVRRRFGLEGGREPVTFTQLADQFGITKQRVQQLYARALDKLRVWIGQSGLELR